MTEPSPDPTPGPATAADVAARLGGVDAAAVVGEVDAVNTMCSQRWGIVQPTVVVDNGDGTTTTSYLPWRADHVAGANLLAVRLYSRRNSPAGVATFGAEGAAYVQRNDPDVAQLLQLGAYTPPRTG